MATIRQLLNRLPHRRQHGPRREMYLMVCRGHAPEISKNYLLKDIETGILYTWHSRSSPGIELQEGHVIRARWTVYWRDCKAWNWRARKLEEPLWSVAKPSCMQVGAACQVEGEQHLDWQFRPIWSNGQVPHLHKPVQLPFKPDSWCWSLLRSVNAPDLYSYPEFADLKQPHGG